MQDEINIPKELNEKNRRAKNATTGEPKDKNDGVQLSSRYLQYAYAKRHLRGTGRPEVFPLSGANSKTLKELTKGQSQGMRVYEPEISTTIASQAGGLGAKTGLYAVPVLTPDRAEKRQNGRRFKTNGEPAFTLTGQDKHGVMVNRKDGIKKQIDIAGTLSSSDWRGLNRNQDQTAIMENMAIRRLTPIETERLQGFPDGWTEYGADGEKISDTQRYKQMGNAVSTPVVSAIISRLK